MSPCVVDRRNAVQRAARTLRDCAPTVLVDVRPPESSRHDAWTLDAVVRSEGIPPEVCRELALEGLTLQPAPSQPDATHVVATK